MAQSPSKPPSQRQLRVGEEIRHAISWCLERGMIHNDAVERHIISVNEVRISPDLKNATAYISVLGGGDTAAVVAGLNQSNPFIRSQVARKISMKYTPRISFAADDRPDYADNINTILKRPDVAADLHPNDGADDPDDTVNDV
jgi:ribosome-binding factor A